MKILIHNTQEEAFAKAAFTIHSRLIDQPNAVLGLATGGTMVRLYASLIALCQQAGTSVSAVTTFNLDEYASMPCEHCRSSRHVEAL